MKSHNFHSTKVMSVSEAAYVAGFVDGEGTIGIIRETRKEALAGFRYTAYISIANTDLKVLEAVREMMGNGRVVGGYQKAAKPHYKMGWKLTLSPNQIRHIIIQLMPYLIVKRKQAELVHDFLVIKETINSYSSNNMEEQYRFWSKARELNQRGKKPSDIPFEGLRPVIRPDVPTCTYEDCKERHYGKGYCRKHYKWMFESKTFQAIGRPNCLICDKPVSNDRPINSKYCSKACKRRANYETWRMQHIILN